MSNNWKIMDKNVRQRQFQNPSSDSNEAEWTV